MKNSNLKKNNKLKKVSTNLKSNELKYKGTYNRKKNKMLMSFDEYFDKNVSEEDKREIEFQTELIGRLIEVRNNKKCHRENLLKYVILSNRKSLE